MTKTFFYPATFAVTVLIYCLLCLDFFFLPKLYDNAAFKLSTQRGETELDTYLRKTLGFSFAMKHQGSLSSDLFDCGPEQVFSVNVYNSDKSFGKVCDGTYKGENVTFSWISISRNKKESVLSYVKELSGIPEDYDYKCSLFEDKNLIKQMPFLAYKCEPIQNLKVDNLFFVVIYSAKTRGIFSLVTVKGGISAENVFREISSNISVFSYWAP